jgi:hypothetical protein
MQKPYLALARFEFEEADGGAEGRVREFARCAPHRGTLARRVSKGERCRPPERSVDGSTYPAQRTTTGSTSEETDGEEAVSTAAAHALWNLARLDARRPPQQG